MGLWDLGLEGQELLNKLEELGDSASEKEQMIATGWFTLREDGTKRLAKVQFYSALSAAKLLSKIYPSSTDEQVEEGKKAQPWESSERLITIKSIWELELGKANADCDDIDEDSEYGHFTVPQIILCSGHDSKRNEWIAIKTRANLHGFSFDYPIVKIKKEKLDIDTVEEYLQNKEELLEWAQPLDAGAISRLITSTVSGTLELKQSEFLADGINYIETSDPCIINPSLYAVRKDYSCIQDLFLDDESFVLRKKVYDGTAKVYENFNIHSFSINCGDNCTSSTRKYYVLEGVDRDTKGILSNRDPDTKTIRFSIGSDPGGSVSLAMMPLSHKHSQDVFQLIKASDRQDSADQLVSIFNELESLVSAEGVFTTSTTVEEMGEVGKKIIDKEISVAELMAGSDFSDNNSQSEGALFFFEAHLNKLIKKFEYKVASDIDEDSVEIDEHVTKVNLPSPFLPTLYFDGITLESPFNIIDSSGFSSISAQGEIKVISGSEGPTYDIYKIIAKLNDTFVLLFERQNYEDKFIDIANIPEDL